jgi:hypothetical protein
VTAKRYRRARPELTRLFALHDAIDVGNLLTLDDRKWIACLLLDIANDVDVRERFHESVKHRPTDDSHVFWGYIDYRVAFEHNGKDLPARREVAAAWGVKPDTVRAWNKTARRLGFDFDKFLSPDLLPGIIALIAFHRNRYVGRK